MSMNDATWKTLTETDEDVVPDVTVSGSDFLQFERDWHAGKHPHERFGQAFVNKFLREGPVRMPKLFHTTDIFVAKNIIVDTFVDWTK
jgi:hypothetical protein